LEGGRFGGWRHSVHGAFVGRSPGRHL